MASQVDSMEEYHQYLTKNYKHGVERFFSPTGALLEFERKVHILTHNVRESTIVKSMDEAVSKLEPVVSGGEGVFDLVAEPGTGKTSVLPFRFPTKKVVVALPTPFDAWSAFQMATGPATLRLKGLSLGRETNVCYMDSYLAANMLLSGFMHYDVLIVDECDSGKGVTAFLAEVKTAGKVLIRMSASLDRTESGPSRAFQVTEDKGLPDLRDGVSEFVKFARGKVSGRTLVLTPDSDAARQVHECLPGSVLVSATGGLGNLAKIVMDQSSKIVYVSDDVCARGMNLNLDTLIDAQLVSEHGVLRNVTTAELYQRKGRVGRNKPGWYISPGLSAIQNRVSEADVFRSNVMRAFAGVEQVGPDSARVEASRAGELLCCETEPLIKYQAMVRRSSGNVVNRSRSTSSSASSGDCKGSSVTGSVSSSRKSERLSVGVAGIMSWFVKESAMESIGKKSYYVSESKTAVVPWHGDDRNDRDGVAVSNHRRRSRNIDKLKVAPDAPYAVVPRESGGVSAPLAIPEAPPVVDLTGLEYHMDWPKLFRDGLASGRAMPTIVPPGNWRHTSTYGLGTNWLQRLESLAVAELSFTDPEFEVVCRAWNKMVAQAWVRRSPGLSSASNEERVEFCVRYFQSYFQLSTM